MTKEYAVKDKKTGLYLIDKYEFGPKHKARRFHSAGFAAYVVKALSQMAEGPFEIEKLRR